MSKNYSNIQISAIVPTFNRSLLVTEAIESVLLQDETVDEIIVIDDGSSDDTREQLTRFGKSIKVLFQKNKGISSARNLGIRSTTFDWLAFLDSDDLWKSNKIKRQKQEIIANPEFSIVYTDEEWRQNNKWKNQKKIHQKFSGWIYKKCLPLCIISPSSVLIHKKVFDRVGFFDENLPACEDYDLWLRIAAVFPVLFIQEKLIIKRAGEWQQLSKQHSLDKYRIIALNKILESGILEPENCESTQKMLINKCKIYINGCLKHNRTSEINWARDILNTKGIVRKTCLGVKNVKI